MRSPSLRRALVSITLAFTGGVLVASGCTSTGSSNSGPDGTDAGEGGSDNPGVSGSSSTPAGSGGQSGSASAGLGGAPDGAAGAGDAGAGTNGGGEAGSMTGGGSGGVSGEAGSNGGPAGEAGSTAEPEPALGLGRLCSDDLDCASLHCVDGVCCESACSGPCQECGGNGRCNVTPADDAACGSIQCPSDTTCRDYDPTLTTRRCASFGTCKGPSACPSTNAPIRTVCGTGRICDGQGTCDYPPVRCGSVSACRTGNCCNESGTPSCLAAGTACGGNTAVISCDGPEDCPPTQICCGISPNSSAPFRSICDEQTDCTSNPGRSVSRLCNPNGDDCGALSCVAFGVPGMYRCQ